MTESASIIPIIKHWPKQTSQLTNTPVSYQYWFCHYCRGLGWSWKAWGGQYVRAVQKKRGTPCHRTSPAGFLRGGNGWQRAETTADCPCMALRRVKRFHTVWIQSYIQSNEGRTLTIDRMAETWGWELWKAIEGSMDPAKKKKKYCKPHEEALCTFSSFL